MDRRWLWAWRRYKGLFGYDMPPDMRAEAFAEWVEAHEEDLIAEHARDAELDYPDERFAAEEAAYYARMGAA